MAAYELITGLITEYIVNLGYDRRYIQDLISPRVYSELISVRLADSNVMIRNKINRNSHQTHIAITGEAIDFFYGPEAFELHDTESIDKIVCYTINENISSLRKVPYSVSDKETLNTETGWITFGKRTQKQVQLSKKNSENSQNVNELRLGLYAEDLIILLKERKSKEVLLLGIPSDYYHSIIPDYEDKYETNTYLRLPYRKSSENG